MQSFLLSPLQLPVTRAASFSLLPPEETERCCSQADIGRKYGVCKPTQHNEVCGRKGGGEGGTERSIAGSQKMVVLVRNPLSSELQCVTLPAKGWSVEDFLRSWCQAQGLPQDHFYVKYNGRCINSEGVLQDGALYSVEPRLCGGKGGFGSMLRALGAQIEKTTNREACRDLSGRRLRDVNHEKAMAEWVKQQAEREADKEQRRLERLKRKLAEPKHFFTNPDYQQQCHEMAERLEDSVLKGMQASSSTVVSAESSESRKGTADSGTGPPSEKKRCLWLGIEGLDDPSSSETNSDEEDESPGTSERCSTSSGSHISVTDNSNEFPRNSEDSVNCSSGSDEKSEDQTKNAKKDLLEDPNFSKIVANEKPKTTQILKEEKHTNASCSEKAASQLQHGDTASVNLMEFNSVAELEAIGLDKLKCELLALGLKCGGTLQERAERLFSVRGLARDHIDPALFAKPSKGKKK
ncbi:splicing regulator SDE2 isoform X1 [Ahaetulla prasina]|uniref:splicing regulator SDE2 isoform X1 n=2 Tax=Ahaetulla prasina TaxID=499056 RepID=UPI0026493E92|nr:splicing regulator SDE2 isoform X1 [Ahaetulla prasina]